MLIIHHPVNLSEEVVVRLIWLAAWRGPATPSGSGNVILRGSRAVNSFPIKVNQAAVRSVANITQSYIHSPIFWSGHLVHNYMVTSGKVIFKSKMDLKVKTFKQAVKDYRMFYDRLSWF